MHARATVEAIARCIKATRKRQGVRQRDLADLAALSCRFLSDLENGKESVELGKALEVLNALGIKVRISSRDQEGAYFALGGTRDRGGGATGKARGPYTGGLQGRDDKDTASSGCFY
jgi:y4mF family transcriptional regulator